MALLASGRIPTITGTLAGQIVMEGFLDLRLPHWLRRIVTLYDHSGYVIVAALYGEISTARLLVLSQVVLSLSCTLRGRYPLVRYQRSGDHGRLRQQRLAARRAILITLTVIGLNSDICCSRFSRRLRCRRSMRIPLRFWMGAAINLLPE